MAVVGRSTAGCWRRTAGGEIHLHLAEVLLVATDHLVELEEQPLGRGGAQDNAVVDLDVFLQYLDAKRVGIEAEIQNNLLRASNAPTAEVAVGRDLVSLSRDQLGPWCFSALGVVGF